MALPNQWRETWTGGPFRPLRSAYDAGAEALADLKREAERVAADPDLTGEGKRAAMADYVGGRPAIAHDALRRAMAETERTLATMRDALTLPEAETVIEEMRRAELRAAFRGGGDDITAKDRQAALLGSDVALLVAVASAPAVVSALPPAVHEQVRQRAIRLLYPAELAEIAEIEAARDVVAAVEKSLAKEVASRRTTERLVPRMTLETMNA